MTEMTEFFASYWPRGYPHADGPKQFRLKAESLAEAVEAAQIKIYLESLTALLIDVLPVPAPTPEFAISEAYCREMSARDNS